MGMQHNWTDKEIQFLKGYVQGHTWKEAAEEFNRRFGCSMTHGAVKAAGTRHGIRTGRDGRYKEGHVPKNKGKRMPTRGRMAEAQYKKGCRPQTWKPVGTESVRKQKKSGQQYLYVKVQEPNVWRMKHILEWERHHGAVPPGQVITFADGDTLNTDISNLVMVSRAQNVVMNRFGIRGFDRESAEVAANIAELKMRAYGRRKGARRDG